MAQRIKKRQEVTQMPLNDNLPETIEECCDKIVNLSTDSENYFDIRELAAKIVEIYSFEKNHLDL